MKDAKELKLMTLEDVLSQIENGMTIGIGTLESKQIVLNKTAFLAKELAMNIVDVNDVEKIDLAIDGADEVDSALNLIKGGGGALFREKVIDEMADRFVVVVDESKLVNYLGETFALPVEVDKFNWYQVAKN